jgi:aspartyl-tRNA(Asn)/glutamyl-tRNA(Gln) amidotransferase subunit A
LACAEASSNLARFDGVRYGYRSDEYSDTNSLYTSSRSKGFGDEVKRRILFGTLALSAEYSDDFYNRAVIERSIISKEIYEILKENDVIMMPTAPSAAYKKGEATKLGFEAGTDDIFCSLASLAGLPAISIPFRSKGSMPVGIQFIGKQCSERLLYSLAHAVEIILGEVGA